MREVVSAYERSHPDKKIHLSFTPLEEAEKTASDVGADFIGSFLSYLLVSWQRGATVDEGKGEAVLSGKDWPEWKPQTVEEYVSAL
jgi:hypothetical protein